MAAKAAQRAAQAASQPSAPREGHEGCHEHFEAGAYYCSCGEFLGITCVVFPEDWDAEKQAALRCEVCGLAGVVSA